MEDLIKNGDINSIRELNEDINLILQLSCKYNQLEIVKWTLANGADPNINDNICFIIVTSNGYLTIVEYLYDYLNLNPDIINMSFLFCCQNGHLNIAQWIYNKSNNCLNIGNNYVLPYTCRYGHLEIIKWLVEIGEKITDLSVIWSCQYGQLFVLQWLIQQQQSIDQEILTHSLKMACRFGHLDIVKWLYKFGIKINYNMIKMACCSESVDLVKWLFDCGFYCQSTVKFCCLNDQFELIKQIYNKDHNLIYDNLIYYMKICCKKGHLDILQWLYNSNITIQTTDMDKLFNMTTKKKQINILEWFLTISDRYQKVNGQYCLPCQLFRINDPEKLKWLNLEEIKTDCYNIDCLICNQTKEYMITLSCLHSLCIECFCYNYYDLTTGKSIDKKCPYRCQIELSNTSYQKNKYT